MHSSCMQVMSAICLHLHACICILSSGALVLYFRSAHLCCTFHSRMGCNAPRLRTGWAEIDTNDESAHSMAEQSCMLVQAITVLAVA